MPQPAPLVVDDGVKLTLRAWRLLEEDMRGIGKPLLGHVVPVQEFLASIDERPTPPAQRLTIVRQAEMLFEQLYAHRKSKEELFGFGDTRVLLKDVKEHLETASETVFQVGMLCAFSNLRDAHTIYGLPRPYHGAVAFLPFQMRCIVDPANQRRFMVSRVMNVGGNDEGFGHEFFREGSEIVHWTTNGIEDHVRRVAATQAGGNIEAAFARGTMACTVRPLQYCHPPFEEEIPQAKVYYRPNFQSTDLRMIRLPWGVARFRPKSGFPRKSFSVSCVDAEFNRGIKRLQYRQELWVEKSFEASSDFREVSHIPRVFEFQFTGGPRKHYPIKLDDLSHPDRPDERYGYLRIKCFSDGSTDPGATDRFVEEARRILEIFDREARDGIVIDIRSNPGGDIRAAERLLQMLTPDRIEPEKFHFPNTPAIREVLRRLRAEPRKPLSKADLTRLEEARNEFRSLLDEPGAAPPADRPGLTAGHYITHPEVANEIGQVYQGRVVLLTDAFTYSAADIFAAGFQDHSIGLILGADALTGAGGANVWEHSDLPSKLGPTPGVRIAKLPRGATMRVAIRRCFRVGANLDKPIEDFGVRPNEIYVTNLVDDVLAGHPGMIRRAVEMLHLMPSSRVDVLNVERREDGAVVEVATREIAKLRFSFDGRFAAEFPIGRNETRTFEVPPAAGVLQPSRMRIKGFARSKDDPPPLAAVRTIALPVLEVTEFES